MAARLLPLTQGRGREITKKGRKGAVSYSSYLRHPPPFPILIIIMSIPLPIRLQSCFFFVAVCPFTEALFVLQVVLAILLLFLFPFPFTYSFFSFFDLFPSLCYEETAAVSSIEEGMTERKELYYYNSVFVFSFFC